MQLLEWIYKNRCRKITTKCVKLNQKSFIQILFFANSANYFQRPNYDFLQILRKPTTCHDVYYNLVELVHDEFLDEWLWLDLLPCVVRTCTYVWQRISVLVSYFSFSFFFTEFLVETLPLLNEHTLLKVTDAILPRWRRKLQVQQLQLR